MADLRRAGALAVKLRWARLRGVSGLPAGVLLLVAGLWVGVGILRVPLGPDDGRFFRGEMLAWLCLLPIAYLATTVHVRRRLPRAVRAAQALFIIVVLVRLATLCLMVDRNGRMDPSTQGHYPGDPSHYAATAVMIGIYVLNPVLPERALAVWVATGGRLVTMQRVGLVSMEQAATEGYAERNVRAAVLREPFTLLGGAMVFLFGYSAPIMILPVTLLSAFLVIQGWIFCERFAPRAAVPWVVLYLLVSPVVVFEASYFRKELYAFVAFLYLFEYLELTAPAPRQPPWPRWRTAGLLLAALLMGHLSRDFYKVLFVGIVLYERGRRRIQPRELRLLVDLLSIAAAGLFIIKFRGGGLGIIMQSLFGLWLMPGPSIFFSPAAPDMTRAIAPLGAIWPIIVAMFTIGVILRVRQGGPFTPATILSVFWMQAIVGAGTELSAQNPGKRACIEVIIIALAAAVPGMLAREAPAVRRWLLLVAGGIALLTYCFHFAVAGLFYLN